MKILIRWFYNPLFKVLKKTLDKITIDETSLKLKDELNINDKYYDKILEKIKTKIKK